MSQRTADIDFSTSSGEMDSETGNYAISVRHPDKPQYAMRLADIYPGCNYYNTEVVGDSVVRILQSHGDLLVALKVFIERATQIGKQSDEPFKAEAYMLFRDAMLIADAAIRRAEEGA